jgi:hypothetical protein
VAALTALPARAAAGPAEPLLALQSVAGRHVALRGSYGGVPSAAAASQGHLYLGLGTRLAVYNVARPDNPVLLAQLGPAPAPLTDILVVGSRAYVGYGRAVEQGRSLAAATAAGLWVLDVSEPNRPLRLATFALPAPASVLALAVQDNRLAVAAGLGGLWLFDIGDPARLRPVGHFGPAVGVRHVALKGQHALVTTGRGQVQLLDLADPARPEDLGPMDLFDQVLSVLVDGRRAYMMGEVIIQVLDITTPTAPREIGGLFGIPPLTSPVLRGTRLYGVIEDQVLVALDFRRPQDPELLGTTSVPETADLALGGDRLYLASPTDGLRILDIVDPELTVEVGALPLPASPSAVQIVNGVAYLADSVAGLQMVDVADAPQPRWLASYGAPGVRDVAVARPLAYLAVGDFGLRVLDVTEPARPREIGAFLPPLGGIHRVAVSGKTALVLEEVRDADRLNVRALDVTIPGEPRDLGRLPAGKLPEVSAIAADDRYAYAGAQGGLQIVDLLSQEEPRLAGAYYTDPFIPSYDVAVDGGRALLAQGDWGLAVIDVSDPRDPVERLTYVPGFQVTTVAALAGDLVIGGLERDVDGVHFVTEVLRLDPDDRLRRVSRLDGAPAGRASQAQAAVALDGNQVLATDLLDGLRVLVPFDSRSLFLPRTVR